ncbi:MAG TPA: O-antigen ligase family protein [Candidatus Sumerlaeota bacterium]|nr:O-antigen ligase family protein [Candidatus Sumerlaeota bacterium]
MNGTNTVRASDEIRYRGTGSGRSNSIYILGILIAAVSAMALVWKGPTATLAILALLFALILFSRPFVTLCLLTALIGMEALNTIQTGEVYSITGIKIVGLILIFSLLPQIALRRFRFRAGPEMLAMLIFLTGIAVGFFNAANMTLSVRAALTYVQLIVLWFAVQLIVNDIRHLRILGIVAILTLAISAFAGIYQYIADPALRISGTSQNAAVLSADLYVALWFCLVLAAGAVHETSKFLWRAMFVLLLAGILCSLSRAAYLAFIPSVLVAAIFYGRGKKALPALIAVIILIAILAPFTIRRLAETSIITDSSTRGHFYSIKAGLKMIADHPIAGVGLGNYPEHYLRYVNDPGMVPRTPHNSYIAIGAEMGIPSLLAFLLIHLLAFRALWKACRSMRMSGDREGLLYAAAIAGALAAVVIIGLFHSLQVTKYLWILLALAAHFPKTGDEADTT